LDLRCTVLIEDVVGMNLIKNFSSGYLYY